MTTGFSEPTPAAPVDPLALFDCPRHQTLRITPQGCGRAWSLARRCTPGDDLALRLGACRGCEIGAQHAGYAPPHQERQQEKDRRSAERANRGRAATVSQQALLADLVARPGQQTKDIAAHHGMSQPAIRSRLYRYSLAGLVRCVFERPSPNRGGTLVARWYAMPDSP